MLIVDGHLDLALNALQGNRDLIRSAYETRTMEFGRSGSGMAQGTVALPEMRRARVALSFVTLLARSTGNIVHHIDYAKPAQAHAMARGQIAYYRALERRGHARVLETRRQLDDHLAEWWSWEHAVGAGGIAEAPPLGFVLLMESADPILEPSHLASWWANGLRIVGPAHFRQGRYAGGTGCEEGLTPLGVALLAEMDRMGCVLDLAHLSDAAFWQALDAFEGTVLVSHANCRTLVPNQRHLDDDQIRAVAERQGVVGLLMGCSDLVPGWVVGARHNGRVTLEFLIDHIDHVCQLTGSAQHVAIGSDLDGGVGRDEFPREIDTIADLVILEDLLSRRGYAVPDIEAILHGNWIRVLRRAWTDEVAVQGC